MFSDFPLRVANLLSASPSPNMFKSGWDLTLYKLTKCNHITFIQGKALSFALNNGLQLVVLQHESQA